MASKRPNTIGSNPLKSKVSKSSSPEQPEVAPAQEVQETREAPESAQLPQQTPGTRARVRRSAKETEALFDEQLKRPEPDAPAPIEQTQAQVQTVDPAANAPVSDRHREAMAIVKTWSQWAVVAGMTPLPILDTIALSGTQIKLIQLLCKHYNIPFERKVAIAVATGLVGGTATSTIAGGVTRALMRNVPIAGQIFNWTVEPALSFGSTYAIGATFVRHFEANGNLMSFKGEQMKDYAAEQYQKGKNLFFSKKNSTVSA